ncbi:uncharacterized protein LOC133200616 [Saccostrea echinata]|uniref:uncharacterized protein LOC133200616 n=1 Tax=Saccostrea echinata TaxID=191078 RepID=UPI002A8266FB|nr:uncharacterized protein LOC133200616 [Saccostrea echinata]
MASDSQESLDLFRGSQDSHSANPNLPPLERPVTMKMIYDEVCSLRQEVQEIRNLMEVSKSSSCATKPGSFQVEGSNVKKPLIAFLKTLFFMYPWISDTDDDLKQNITAILSQCGWEVNGSMLVTCFSFASHSFTSWRNQVRQKLVTPEKNVEGMPLKALQRYLYSAFWVCPSPIDEKTNFKVTLALRAFADGHKLFKKSSDATSIDFWRAFRKNIDAMMKQSPERWVALEQRIVKKIEASNKED